MNEFTSGDKGFPQKVPSFLKERRDHPERCYKCYDHCKERRRREYLDSSLPRASRLLSLIA